jgi:hypothetical protein
LNDPSEGNQYPIYGEQETCVHRDLECEQAVDQDEETHQSEEIGERERQPQSHFAGEGRVKNAKGTSDEILHWTFSLIKQIREKLKRIFII